MDIGFNPHPARGPGATVLSRSSDTSRDVSTLTRPEGRVQHGSFFRVFVR